MAQKSALHPLLDKPLYVFDLPTEILQGLSLRAQQDRAVPDVQSKEQPPLSEKSAKKTDSETSSTSVATSCSLCGLIFGDVQEQRSHVRSDLHAYNLKQKVRGRKPVNEAEFEKLIGELDESISGSEHSESDEVEDEDDEVEDGTSKPKQSSLSALLKRQAKLSSPDSENSVSLVSKQRASRAPLIWLASPTLPENLSLGVYRAIFSKTEQEEESHIVESLCQKQLSPVPAQISHNAHQGLSNAVVSAMTPHYFLCMVGGGHFAAMVVALAPRIAKKHSGVNERQATVIAHKTFHRYTTRRKQGGSQSANDAAKGNAHSAGSSLRRYNEAALTSEIRALLGEWRGMIDSAELCFIRASGTSNRRVLFGPYDGQVLQQNDVRNRGFPFSTRRATQSELMRAFVELTRVKISSVLEVNPIVAREVLSNSEPGAAQTTSRARPPKERTDEIAVLHTTQLTSLIRRSKAPALISYLSSNELSPDYIFQPTSQHAHAPAPLHLASASNNPVLVLSLLTKARANPTFRNDEGKTPFQLANDRWTRDAFRVARFELGESFCSWEDAKVPAALSRSDFERRQQRDTTERQAAEMAEGERRKAEADRMHKESENEEKSKRNGLATRSMQGKALSIERTGAEKREEAERGMTPEMRQKLERERRARAAEERIRKMQGSATRNNDV